MPKHPAHSGFTLAETLISFSILSIVSLLAYIVLASSTEAARLTEAQAQLQSNLRDVMQAISSEVRSAYSERSIDPQNPGEVSAIGNDPSDLPVGTIQLIVSATGRQITFQRPEASLTNAVPRPSTVITIGLESEDAGFATGNAELDAGEDANADGILTRRVIRTQDGATAAVGGVNDIADLQFALMPSEDPDDLNDSTLLVRLTASKLVGAKKRLVTSTLESRVRLEN